MTLAAIILAAVAIESAAVAILFPETSRTMLRSVSSGSLGRFRAIPALIVHRGRQRLALSLLGAYLRVSGRHQYGLVVVPVREGR